MLTEAELDALAKELLREAVDQVLTWDANYFHEIYELENGEVVLVYGSTSQEGYGSFLCEFMSLATVKKVIQESEQIFDECPIVGTDSQTGEVISKPISELWGRSRESVVRWMAQFATLHLVAFFRARLGSMIEETVGDCKIIANAMLVTAISEAFVMANPGIHVKADVTLDIEEAAKRVADKKRVFLRRHMEKLPHIIAEQEERGRGGSDPRVPVSDEQCSKFAADYPTLLQHWKGVASLRRQGLDWRAYGNLISDMPEDLLDKLDNQLPDEEDSADYPNIPSVLAHEHAARRCGIPANTYRLSTHKNLRSRGNQLRSQIKDSE